MRGGDRVELRMDAPRLPKAVALLRQLAEDRVQLKVQ